MNRTKNKNRLFLAVALPWLLSGCATVASVDTGETLAEIQDAVREGIGEHAPASQPPDISAALMPEVRIDIPGADADALAQRFDVKVRRAPARDFFLGLVEDTPYNLVLHPDVSGSIDLDLKNVTVPEVMDVVRDAYGYDYERRGSVYQVFPNTVRTRIFQVDYPHLRRTGTSSMSARPGNVGEGTRSSSADGEGGKQQDQASGGSRVESASETDFWAQLANDLQAIVGTGEDRQISVNPIAGLVMVRARPDQLRDVARFLEASATSVQRQVTLEARVLEVTLNEGFRQGVNWAAIANGSGNLGLFSPGGGQSATVDTMGSVDTATGLFTGNALSSSVTAGLTLGLFGEDFAALIDLLKNQGDVQVLSSPRVSTVNNQKAVIKVGSDEFFVTDVESNTTTGTATTTNVSVELTPFFSGVSLDVTPQISEAGDVILHIHPAVSEVAEQQKTVNTSFGTLQLPLAASTIRESDSMIRARNGQIVVIGGLMQNSLRTDQSKVPLLGDLPLIGGLLFGHTEESKQKTELVILLKPTVIEGPAEWSKQLERSSETFGRIDSSAGVQMKQW